MFYETTTKVTRINERGEEKQVIERYVIQNCETFREAEERAARRMPNTTLTEML